MPSHELHEIIDLIVLGRKFSQVHDFMDSYQPFLQSNHRIYFHDMRTVQMITRTTGDIMAGEAAFLHVLLDQLSDTFGKTESVPILLHMIRTGQVRL